MIKKSNPREERPREIGVKNLEAIAMSQPPPPNIELSDERSSAPTSSRLPTPTHPSAKIRTSLNLTTQHNASQFSSPPDRKPMAERQTPVPTCPHQNRKIHTALNLSSPLKCVAVLSSKTAQDSISPPFSAPFSTKSKPI